MKEEADIKQIYGIRLFQNNEHTKGTKMEFEFGHQNELGDSQKWVRTYILYLNDKMKRENSLRTLLTIEEKLSFSICTRYIYQSYIELYIALSFNLFF